MKKYAVLLAAALAACSSEDPPKQVINVSYAQVVADYKSNGLVADEKYNGKLISFPAIFYKVTKGIGGDTVEAFEGKSAVIAIFETSSEAVLKTLQRGDRFVMTCAVALSGTILNDCEAKK